MAVVEMHPVPRLSYEDAAARRLATTISAYDSLPIHFTSRYDSVDTEDLRSDFIRRLPSDRRPVLDAGCGTGRDLVGFDRAGVRALGLDLSRGLLRVAASRTTTSPLVRADMRLLPFADETCRGAWAMASLVHLDRCSVVQALCELRRVLIPDGLLFATLIHGDDDGWRADSHDQRRWFTRHTVSDVRKLASEAGFTLEQLTVSTGSIGGDWINLFARPAEQTGLPT